MLLLNDASSVTKIVYFWMRRLRRSGLKKWPILKYFFY